MLERGVFDQLRVWLLGKGYGYCQLFWITGGLAFCISPVADNLTTALIMCAVVMAVGRENGAFVSLSCINIVVGANAGGACAFGASLGPAVLNRVEREIDPSRCSE